MSIFNSLLAAAGAAGLEVETGTWTPETYAQRGQIDFKKAHSEPPSFCAVFLDSSVAPTQNTNIGFSCVDIRSLLGCPALEGYPYVGMELASYSESSTYTYASRAFRAGIEDTSDSDFSHYRYYANESCIKPYGSKYWKNDYNYKWIAIWT